MKKFHSFILAFAAASILYANAADNLFLSKDKLALAEEGEKLRYQSIEPSDDGFLIVDSAKLRKSVQCLLSYSQNEKKPEAKYMLMLADNYFLLHDNSRATEIFQSYQNDGLSQLRLGEMLYSKYAPKNTLHKSIYHLNRGLSTASILTKDYTQASVTVSRILPLCYFQLGDINNASRYHSAYTSDNEPETKMWLYQLYWLGGKKEEALQCAQQAMQLDPNNPVYSEQVAACYFNLGKHDLAFPYWKNSADRGSALGHIRVAQSYHTGTGCEQNDSLAAVHLEQGLDSLDWLWAQKLLAQIYLTGDSSTNPVYNIDRAHFWLYKASEKGDWKSCSTLAESLVHCAHQQQDANQRLSMLRQANKLAIQLAARNINDSLAWYILGAYIGDSLLSQPKPDLATLKAKRKYLAIDMQRDLTICQMLADAGYIEEIVQLGKAYSTGQYKYNDYFTSRTAPIDTNYVAALQYFRRGLVKDPKNVDCIIGITNAYSYGWGVKRDIMAAKKFWEDHDMYNYASTYFYPWRTHRIRQGNIDEIIYMYSYYDPAKLVMPISESLRWLRNASQNGNKEQRNMALYLLGGVYEKGILVEQDCNTAITYYKQSAELGNANANHHLGMLFKDGGCGILRNATSAAKYFRQAYQISGNQEENLLYLECINQQ